jgi:hypothetical protein
MTVPEQYLYLFENATAGAAGAHGGSNTESGYGERPSRFDTLW